MYSISKLLFLQWQATINTKICFSSPLQRKELYVAVQCQNNPWTVKKNQVKYNLERISPMLQTFFRKTEVSLRCQLFLCFWLCISSHDAMNSPAMVFEWFKIWVCTLTDITAVWFRLFVSEQVFLQTVHRAKPAKTDRATHRLDGRLASPTPLVKHKTDCVREIRVAVGTVISLGWICGWICNPSTFASIQGYVPPKGTASGKCIAASCAYNPLLLFSWIWKWLWTWLLLRRLKHRLRWLLLRWLLLKSK